MKRFLFALFLVVGFVFSVSNVEAYVSVSGYYRSDGTYVKPHVRSNPNGIKFDNYGWKPSQGLYNKSYGSRGSSWNTPSYITDPDYYEGKSLYDRANNSYDFDFNLSNDYSYPTIDIDSIYDSADFKVPSTFRGKATPACSGGAEWNSYYDRCQCPSGHSMNNMGYCVVGSIIPSRRISCMPGKTANSLTGECEYDDPTAEIRKLNCDSNQTWSDITMDCVCRYNNQIMIDGVCTYKEVDDRTRESLMDIQKSRSKSPYSYKNRAREFYNELRKSGY